MVICVLHSVISIREFHGLSTFEVQMAIEKLKRHKSPDIDQIPAELIKAGGRTFLCEITNFIKSIWNMAEFLVDWKESIILPVSKKGYKTTYSNYRAMSHLLTTYKVFSNILLSKLTPYVEEIIGDH